MKFRVTTWYDTITSESAENGDYESTGNDMREYTYTDLSEAVEHALRHLNCLDNEEDLERFKANPCDEGVVILYSADPVVDYHNGDEDMHTVCIKILRDGE